MDARQYNESIKQKDKNHTNVIVNVNTSPSVEQTPCTWMKLSPTEINRTTRA